MRRRRFAFSFFSLVSLIIALAPGSICVAQAQGGTQASEAVRQEIIAREKASFAAWTNQDKAFYADYWADDMTEFLPGTARLLRKKENMEQFEKFVREWRLESIEMINPEVRAYGNVAVLTYQENVSGKEKGKQVRYSGKVTMIYVKQGDTWRGVHYHESKN